jgi:hypothetical protein
MTDRLPNPTFYTLGPSGTCHEAATRAYLRFQGLQEVAALELIDDFAGEGLEHVREEPNSFLVQCSAHREVHTVTERYPKEVFVAETFIWPTQELALVVRGDVDEPSSLGLVAATHGYTDLDEWPTIVDIPTKPEVAQRLFEDREFDAGIVALERAREYSDDFHILEHYGNVLTSWLVYASRTRFAGEVIGQRVPGFFTGQASPEA